MQIGHNLGRWRRFVLVRLVEAGIDIVESRAMPDWDFIRRTAVGRLACTARKSEPARQASLG